MDNLKFYEEQLERIKNELATEKCFEDTQRYVNLTSVSTNLIGFIRQLEGIQRAEEEEKRRRAETEKIIAETENK